VEGRGEGLGFCLLQFIEMVYNVVGISEIYSNFLNYMDSTVQIRKKGQFTIPVAMREKLGIEENEIVTVSMINDSAILIIPKKLKVTAILEESSKLARKKGISLEEMLADLDEIRHNL